MGVSTNSTTRIESFRSEPAKREGEESARGKLIDSFPWIDLMRRIGKGMILQFLLARSVPLRRIGMTSVESGSELGSTPL